MPTKTVLPASLPFELGEARSLEGLTIVPLFAAAPPEFEYVGLDRIGTSRRHPTGSRATSLNTGHANSHRRLVLARDAT
jgi:hypothetical protein